MGPPIYIGGNDRPRVVGVFESLASMGPPIYIGGNVVIGLEVGCLRIGFNGATDLHRWKPPR